MMEHKEGYFNGVRNTRMYWQAWRSASPAKAVLIIVHGLAEHGGRYMNLVNRFVPAGYHIYALDHIGHGRSDGKRCFVKHFDDFTDNLHTFVHFVKEEAFHIPIYMVGHSMGGLVTAAYLVKQQVRLAGAVLSGPLAKIPQHISKSTIISGRIISQLLPGFRLIPLDGDGVCRDPKVVDAYENDPLVFRGKITARLGSELLLALLDLKNEMSKIKLPLLILQGGEDRLVDADGAQLLFDQVQSEDKTLKIYPELYHEVFNEPEKEMVLTDMENWLEKQLAEQQKSA